MTTNPHFVADPNAIVPVPGGKEWKIYPRGLNIVWGNDRRYWRIEEQKTGMAELLQVSWLEVTGKVPLRGGKKYRVGFKISMKPDAFGWADLHVVILAKVGTNGRLVPKKEALNYSKVEPFDFPQDGVEVEVPENGDDVHFGMYEVWSGKWKGGLLIHHAFVREA
ncbi:Phloem protein 2-like [Dillenia turbinata]|uniref:Phloem protein 2-like n=1 Tax=Dillenia turbinata TaxID=194707 RepID=A0AAN8UK99_9MAGN